MVNKVLSAYLDSIYLYYYREKWYWKEEILAYKGSALYALLHKKEPTRTENKSSEIRNYTIPYDRWTVEETADLIAEYNGGRSIKDIAWGHNRTQKAIRMALDKLREKGLIYE